MKNLLKIFFIIVYVVVIVALGIYYPVILNLHPTDASAFVTTICQIGFFSTPILVIAISMSKFEKKEKIELFTGLVIGLGVILLIRFFGLGLLGRL